jgi:branched-chain amino acid transport system ATP-binding protein
MPDGKPLLAAHGLVKRFGGLCVVDQMSIAVARGEIVGLIGPNGAGKTTLFNLLAGSLRPDAGEIILDGETLTNQPAERRMASGLGRTFQIPRPFANMSVLENVLAGVQGQSGERILPNFIRPGRVARQEGAAGERAVELLAFVSLDHLRHEPARVLSGGQRKLLELARVMAADPTVILLDEPGAGVNPTLLDLICDRIVEINRSGVTVLLIEHNMEMVARLCSRVVVMASGRLLAEGTPAEITDNRDVLDAYLGGPLH